MYLLPEVVDSAMIRPLNPGDFVASQEPIPPAADTTNTNLSYTALNLLNTPVYVRNPAGVSTDTFPTADAMITNMRSGLGQQGVIVGLAFRWRVINLSANLLTGAVVANSGVTMTRGNVPASTTKDFLVKITNGTPMRTAVNITSANGSAILRGFQLTDLQNLSVGMVVTNAVVGLQGQTIAGIDLNALTVTMSGNANAAGPSSFTFSPTYQIVGLAA